MIKSTVRKFSAVLFFCNFIFTSVGFSSGSGERCASISSYVLISSFVVLVSAVSAFFLYYSIGVNSSCSDDLKLMREVVKNITQIRADSGQDLK